MDPDDDCGYQVELFVYDLSGGMAPVIGPALLGKHLDGIWHTGVVAYGREYFFGAGGIESCKPGGTVLGEPNRIEALGESQVPYQLFLEYIFGLGESSYRPGAYDLLKHNCNNFSDEIAQFLCGRGIPKAILQLPDEVINTPLGIKLNEALKKFELKHANSRSINFGPLSSTTLGRTALQVVRTNFDDPEFDELNDAIDQVRHNSVLLEERRNSLNDKLSKKERKEKRREKRERKEKRRKEKGESSGERRSKKKNKPPLPPQSTSGVQLSPSPESDRFECERIDTSALPENNSPAVKEEQAQEEPSQDNNQHTETFTPVDDFWGNQDDEDNELQTNNNTPDDTTAPATEQQTDNIVVEEVKEEETEEQHTTDPPIEELQEQPQEIIESPPAPEQEEYTPPEPPQPSSGSRRRRRRDMADQETSVPEEPQATQSERRSSPPAEVEETPREPPILFKDEVDGRRDFDELVGCCMHMLTEQEQQHMEELRSYVVEDDGAWALGENFGELFSRIFNDTNIPDEARHHLVRILAVAALKDDVILLLHQDRKDHTIMNFANKIEHLPPHIQEAIALFFCNMFEHMSPSEWLLYISEWTVSEGGTAISNIRVTTKVAVNALLHSNDKVQNYGTALMYNLGTKEVKTVVFDDVAPELAMAILQYLSNPTSEEHLWRALTALCRFCYASSEVPSLIKMIGPEPTTFKGKSERIDTVIEELGAKLSRVRLY